MPRPDDRAPRDTRAPFGRSPCAENLSRVALPAPAPAGHRELTPAEVAALHNGRIVLLHLPDPCRVEGHTWPALVVDQNEDAGRTTLYYGDADPRAPQLDAVFFVTLRHDTGRSVGDLWRAITPVPEDS
jgi:hypothetical protein